MSAAMSSAARNVVKHNAWKLWSSDVAAWPIVGILGGASVFATYKCYRFLTANPDVRVSREKRSSPVSETHAVGQSWVSFHEALRHTDPEEYRITHSLVKTADH